MRHANVHLERLRPELVRDVLVKIVALRDRELEAAVARRLPQQAAAHLGLADARAAAEAEPHEKRIVGCPAAPGVRVSVCQVYFEKRSHDRLYGARVRASPEHAGRCESAEAGRPHLGGRSGHAGSVARQEAIEARQRIDDGRSDLAPQAGPPGRPGPAHEPGRAVKYLAEGNTPKRRVDEIVQGGLVGFAEVFPGTATERGDGR